MDNPYIETGEEVVNLKDYRSDPKVSGVLELLKAGQNNPDVLQKKESINEDVELKKDFHALLPGGRAPLMKSSLYAIASRKIRVTGVKTPKYFINDGKVEAQVAQDLIDEGLEDINFDRIHKSIYDKYETQGSGVTVLREIDGELTAKVVDFDDIMIDPMATFIADEWKGDFEGNARWFAFREKFKRNTFNKLYEELADKVTNGSPLVDNSKYALESDGTTDTDVSDIEKDVEVWHIFSLMDKKPVQISIAGGNAYIVEDLKGYKYKYRANNGKPFLPICLFSLSNEKVGLWSSSLVGFVKDGAELLKKAWNATVRNSLRIADAPTYMFGSVDETDIHEMVNYYQQAEMGYTPIIQRQDPNVSIQTLAPPDVSSTFAQIKSNTLDDLSERLGFQLRRHEDNPQMKVNIYVRQEMDEGEAVKAIDRRNEDVYKRLFLFVYWMKRDLAPHKKRTTKIEALGDIGELELKAKDVKEILKDYTPKIQIDTDMDAKLTFQERVQANDIVANDLMTLYSSNIQDQKVADVLATLRYNKAVKLGLKDQVKKDDFIDAATVEPPVQPEIPQGMQGMQGEPTGLESIPLGDKAGIPGEPKAMNNLV